MIEQLSLFDYNTLDTETRIVVQQRTTEIKALMKRAASDIIEIGQKLIEVKARLGHGSWLPWLRAEFAWSEDTASRFMAVARRIPEIPHGAEFDARALYLLAATSTPDSARDEALERAGNGETITHQAARDIVSNHRNPPTPFVPNEEDDEPLTPYEEGIATQYIEYLPSTTIEQAPADSRSAHVMRVMGSSESPEWYTPAYIIDLVLRLFEVISVDPCSNSHERPNVPAETRYTKDDDGLSHPWHGNVYMNPPYGDEIGPWVERMVGLYRAREIDQAIALLPGRIDTVWFQPLYDYPMCNVRGRVKFQNAENSAPFPSVIVYLGADEQGFIDTFRQLGPIVKRIA